MEHSKCGGILHLMSRLILQSKCSSSNGESHAKSQKLSTTTLGLLNGAMAFLNGLCVVSVDLVRGQVLEFELEIYHILIVLLHSVGSRFMENGQNGGDSVRALCSGLMQFITATAMQSTEIQDMFRFISCDAPTLLTQLCRFPFFFFLNDDGKLSLFPTLIAVTFENAENLSVLNESIDIKHIRKWIKKRIQRISVEQRFGREMEDGDRLFMQKVPPRHWARCLQLY